MSHLGDETEDFTRKITHVGHHPGEEDDHGHHNRHDLRNKGEGGLVYGGDRLENADDETNDKTENQKRRSKKKSGFETATGQLYDQIGGHENSFKGKGIRSLRSQVKEERLFSLPLPLPLPLPAFHPKLFTSEPIINPHPSTRIKRSILKGSDIMTGGSIIIPIDMSTEATTISTTRKGM
jgi:hypothetical protein